MTKKIIALETDSNEKYECITCKDYGWIIRNEKIIICPTCHCIHKPKE